MRLDVRPALSASNQADGTLGKPKYRGDLTLRKTAFAKRTYLGDLNFIDLSLWKSASSCLTPLCRHVGAIIRLRTKEQMERVDTCRIVASVEDAEAVRDLSARQFPTETMRVNRFPDSAVASFFAALPFPTRLEREGRSGTGNEFVPKRAPNVQSAFFFHDRHSMTTREVLQ